MSKWVEIEGKRFGRVVALWHSYTKVHHSGRKQYYECICDCGKRFSAEKSGISTRNFSCGCFQRETLGNIRRRHGMAKTQLYYTWLNIKRRCYKTDSEDYNSYGARGVVMCDEWRSSFDAFRRDMGERPSPKHSIDRIDNNKGYEPGNCRWATVKEQARNKSTTRYLLIRGERKPLTEWCEQYGVNPCLVRKRLRRGWTDEDALQRSVFAGKGNKFRREKGSPG